MSQIDLTRSRAALVTTDPDDVGATTEVPPAPSSSAAVADAGPNTATLVDTLDTGASNETDIESPTGKPRVDGAVDYDPELGAVTLADIEKLATVATEVNKTSGGDASLNVLLAKLLIAFEAGDSESAKELLAQAKERAAADQAREKDKAAKVDELVALAKEDQSQPRCLAKPRLESKLEELGYTPEQAHKLASDMTAKNISPGAQALMATEAVEKAPLYKDKPADAAGATSEHAVFAPPSAAERASDAAAAEDDAKGKLALMMILLGVYANGLDPEAGADDSADGEPAGAGGTPVAAPTPAANSSAS